MQVYYDVVLKNDITHSSVSYWADSFSVSNNRILKIESVECGDICVKIDLNERLVVHDVIIFDEFDDLVVAQNDFG